MANVVSNVSKGRFHEYAVQARDVAASAFILVPLSAVEADAAVVDHDDLAALLGAAGNTELTTGGWNRKTITGGDVVVTVDDTNERVDIDIPDQTWTAVTAGNSVALILAFDDDTGAGTDANIIPISKHDFSVTADGSDVTAQIDAAGILRAAQG